MKRNESISWSLFNTINIMCLLFLTVITLYPMVYVLFASMSKPSLFMAHQGILLWPDGLDTEAYRLVFKNPMIGKGYRNTIFIVVVGVAINIIMTSLGAYFLSRKNVLWRNVIMFLIIFTMYFSGGLIPFYMTVKQLHIDNSLWALILPSAINTFNLIIMRTAFAGIPDSMEESAKLDGAKHFTILFRIILPLSLPTVAVMILYYSVGHWNSWFNALLFIRKRDLYPLQLILREILLSNDTNSMLTDIGNLDKGLVNATIKYAVVIVATLPVLAIYPFLQKYFVHGVMIGALKE